MFSRRSERSSDGESKSVRRSKRERSTSNLSDEDLANCLVLLSNSGAVVGDDDSDDVDDNKHGDGRGKSVNKGKTGPAFQCKACKKVFSSHQALGGHRASHKKVKGCFASEDKEEEEEEEEEEYDNEAEEEEEEDDDEEEEEEKSTAQITKKRSNAHECTICHRVFASGQALGGHKRCHWLTPSNSLRTSSFHGDAEAPAVGSKCEPLDRSSLDLNLAFPEYSVDRTVINVGGGGSHSSSSWLQLASGDNWF